MHIVPSDIVGYIDKVFPMAAQHQASGTSLDIHPQRTSELSVIVELVDELNTAFLPTGDTFVKLRAARWAIKTFIKHEGDPRSRTDKLGKLREYGLDPIVAIREIASSLSDVAIPENATGLEFMHDQALRNELLADIASVSRLIYSAEWRSAAVMAASVMEALLLWALREYGEERAIAEAKQLQPPIKQAQLDRYQLAECIKLCHHLDIIKKECSDQADVARESRDLIHAGRRIRKKKVFERKDAISCWAGLEHVVSELSAWCASRKAEMK